MTHLKSQQKKHAVLSAYFLAFLLEGNNTIVTNVLHGKVKDIKERVSQYLKSETEGYVHKFIKELFTTWTDYFLGDKKAITIHSHEEWSYIIAWQTLIVFYETDCIKSTIWLAKKQAEFFSSDKGKLALVEVGYKEEEANRYLKLILAKEPVSDGVS